MKTIARVALPDDASWPRLGGGVSGSAGTGSRRDHGAGAGGPVAAMHDAPNARLSAAEYERWLLPPEPRDAMERTVHALSLSAGVLALTGGAALMWLVL